MPAAGTTPWGRRGDLTQGGGARIIPIMRLMDRILQRLRQDPVDQPPPASCAAMAAASGWNAELDPFVYHRHQAVRALSEGVVAAYGYAIRGDIAEFGTMTGETAAGLAVAIAGCDRYLGYAVQMSGAPLKQLYLFDSFAGLPVAEHASDVASPHVRDGVWSPGACIGIGPEELARKVTAHIPAQRVRILPGWFKDTVPQLPAEVRFALVHVDSDLYASAMDALDGLFGRGLIAEGALIYFDDWNCNRASNEFGERRAWRECVERYSIVFSDEGNYGIFARRFTVHSYQASEARS